MVGVAYYHKKKRLEIKLKKKRKKKKKKKISQSLLKDKSFRNAKERS